MAVRGALVGTSGGMTSMLQDLGALRNEDSLLVPIPLRLFSPSAENEEQSESEHQREASTPT